MGAENQGIKDLYLTEARLNQTQAKDGLQDLIEMWWSGRGDKGKMPEVTSATIHYRIVPKSKRRRNATR